MPEPDYIVRQGDHGIAIRAFLREPDDSPANLTGILGVTFRLRPIGGGPLKVNAAATVGASPATGEVFYVWLAADTDTPGLYVAEFKVNHDSSTTQTYPNGRDLLVLITEDIA